MSLYKLRSSKRARSSQGEYGGECGCRSVHEDWSKDENFVLYNIKTATNFGGNILREMKESGILDARATYLCSALSICIVINPYTAIIPIYKPILLILYNWGYWLDMD